MSDDYFSPDQLDYIERLNVLLNQFKQSNNLVNPRFSSFGGTWVIPDVRGAGTKPPNAYQNAGAVIEFNDGSNFNYPPSVNNSYGYVLTIVGYTNDGLAGGGTPVQIAFSDSISVRRANSGSSWGPWRRLANYDDQVAQFGTFTNPQSLIVSGNQYTCALILQNAGDATLAFGNKSALIGGTPDKTPYIYSGVPIGVHVGMNVGGTVAVKGLSEAFRTIDDGGFMSFFGTSGATRNAYIQAINGQSLVIMPEANHTLRLGSNGLLAAELDYGGNFRPVADGVKYNGVAALRWAAVYAATGAIQTSDARKKTAVVKMTANMRAAARQMLSEIGTYQWLESIKEKGEDGARCHIGFTVQRAIEILQDHDIDPFKMAFICHDTWDERVEKVQINVGAKVKKTVTKERQKLIYEKAKNSTIEMINGKAVYVETEVDVPVPQFIEHEVFTEDGRKVMRDENTPYIHKVPVMEQYAEEIEVDAEPEFKETIHPAGDCYAFRYDQLALFILSGLHPD